MLFNKLNYLGTRWKVGQKMVWKRALNGEAWAGIVLTVFKDHFEIKWGNDSFITICGLHRTDIIIDDQSS